MEIEMKRGDGYDPISVPTIRPDEYASFGLTRQKVFGIYRKMVLIRTFEREAEDLYVSRGVLGGLSHLYLGEEAIAPSIVEVMKKGDMVLGTYRGHGHALALGVEPEKVMAELYGKEGGVARGLAGSMHVIMDPDKGALYSTAIVGSHIPISVGVAYAMKYDGTDNMTITFFGDGTANIGAFFEGLNMAGYLKVPVLFVVENNMYSEYTRTSKVLSGGSIAKRAESLGIPTLVADGNDPFSVYRAAKTAEADVRSGKPMLIEAVTYRMKGHNPYDEASYRPSDEVKAWLSRDPIEMMKRRLLDEGYREEELTQVEEWAKNEVESAEKFAESDGVLPFSALYGFV
ncbi:thiamine pyrophosphate-dependent dehydrogenase E1 component subunit alpha [Tardisphaera miroshnichenkoae]